jgi:hypothetical protein
MGGRKRSGWHSPRRWSHWWHSASISRRWSASVAGSKHGVEGARRALHGAIWAEEEGKRGREKMGHGGGRHLQKGA